MAAVGLHTLVMTLMGPYDAALDDAAPLITFSILRESA
jgi:hypothetical protein